MHELGVLRHIVKTVARITEEQHIARVSYIALEVGEAHRRRCLSRTARCITASRIGARQWAGDQRDRL